MIALYYGVGHFLVTLIILSCICLYFNEMREEKLEEVLTNCGSVAPEWAHAYRNLIKYIREIEVVYAQINLSSDTDFRNLL